MMTAGTFSEDTLTIALFGQLGWQALNCYDESAATLDRETTAEVGRVIGVGPSQVSEIIGNLC